MCGTETESRQVVRPVGPIGMQRPNSCARPLSARLRRGQVCRPRVVRRGAASPCGQSPRTDYRNHYDPVVSTRTTEPVPTLAENRAGSPLSQE